MLGIGVGNTIPFFYIGSLFLSGVLPLATPCFVAAAFMQFSVILLQYDIRKSVKFCADQSPSIHKYI